MINLKSSIYTLLISSVLFTLILLLVRIILSYQLTYIFYAWNLFLAIIPLCASSKLSKHTAISYKSILLLGCWLLFFPNAPYIVTDLFHFAKREPIPLWYDLLIATTATWNGLLLGFISLLQVESFLKQFLNAKKLNIAMLASFILCGFGVYLGRYLRFNSWDIINNFDDLIYQIAHRFVYPYKHAITWGFTFLFATMLALFYYTIKAIAQLINTKQVG